MEMLHGRYGLDGLNGQNGNGTGVGVQPFRTEASRIRLITKVYFSEPDRGTAELFRRSSGMNGTALPSEDLFNHACRFRRAQMKQILGSRASNLLKAKLRLADK